MRPRTLAQALECRRNSPRQTFKSGNCFIHGVGTIENVIHPNLRSTVAQGSNHLAMLFKVLGEKRHQITRFSSVVDFRAGQIIHEAGKPPSKIGYILEGTLAMTATLPGGRTNILGLLVPTCMYGRVFENHLPYQIEALTDSKAYCIERAAFEDILKESPEIERLFLITVLDELDAAREWIVLIGSHKVIERVAAFLLILCRRKILMQKTKQFALKSAIVVKIEIKRKDLARYLGVRVESLSRAFHELEDRKVLRIIDAYTVEIINVNILITISSHDLLNSATVTG